MDLAQLSELMECPVCLESMQTNSRVLPCQHFFCVECLRKIWRTEREVRCPECRAVCETPVEQLPTSILLMRILEGMKKSGYTAIPLQEPKKRRVPTAKALYNYQSEHPRDLPLSKGDLVTIRRQVDENWFYGEKDGKAGCFPAPFVKVLVPLPVEKPAAGKSGEARPFCKALYDFNNSNEEDCLQFKKDDSIVFIRMVDDNWAEGKLGDKIGIFPVTYVELNVSVQSARLSGAGGGRADTRYTAAPTATSRDGRSVRGAGGSSSCMTTSTGGPSVQHKRHSVAGVPPAIHGQRGPTSGNLPTSHYLQRHSMEILDQPTTTVSTCPLAFSSSTSTAVGPESVTMTTSSRYDDSHVRRKVGQLCPLPPRALTSPTSPTHQALTEFDLAIAAAVGESSAGDSLVAVLPPRVASATRAFPPPPPESGHRRVAVSQLQGQGQVKVPRGGVSVTSAVSFPARVGSAGVVMGTNAGKDRQNSENAEDRAVGCLTNVYIANYSYEPQAPDELGLVRGQSYRVTERCHDGWYRGTCQTTARNGVFPGNYVTMAMNVKNSPTVSNLSNAENGDVRNIRATAGPATSSSAVSPTSSESTREITPASKDHLRVNRRELPVPAVYTNINNNNNRPAMYNPIRGVVPPSHSRSGSLPSDTAPALPPKPTKVVLRHRRSSSISTGYINTDILPRPVSMGLQHSYQNERYKCVAPYRSQTDGELNLCTGDTVFVQTKGKGWYTGTQPKTGLSGQFPAACVERY